MSSPQDDIPQKIQQLQNLQSQIRFWRTLTVVAVLLIVLTCVGLISASVNQLRNPGPVQQEYVDELMTGVNEDVVPELQRLAMTTLSEMTPMVRAQLDQLNMKAPEFADAIRRELYKLSVNVSSRSEDILKENLESLVQEREEWIRTNFDGVTRDRAENMADNLAIIATEELDGITTELFAEHITALNDITENLQKIQQEELANVEQEIPNWEMALLFFDVVRQELRAIESSELDVSAIDEQAAQEITEEEGGQQ